MNPQYTSLWTASFGIVLIGALFVGVTRARRLDEPHLRRLLAARLHYGLVGALAGYTAFPGVRATLAGAPQQAGHFLVAWFGLLLGLQLDRRSLRRGLGTHLFLDLAQAGAVVLVVLPVGYLGWSLLSPSPVPYHALLIVTGICCAVAPGLARAARARARGATQPDHLPLAACLGLLVAGLGAFPLRGGIFEIRLPFVPEIRAILVQSTLAEMGWSIALGCLTGLVVDMLTRSAERRMLLVLVMAGLALGAGTAAGLGLEPAWIGFVAGAWLINSTLRRREFLRGALRSQELMRIGLLSVAGWVLGDGMVLSGLSAGVVGGVLVLLVLVRPAAAWAGRWLVRSLAPLGVLKGAFSREGPPFPQVELIGLALALGVVELVGGRVGTSTLAGVMGAQWLLTLVGTRQSR